VSFITASVAMRNLRATANRDALAGGKLALYEGVVPVDVGPITSQVLIGQFALPAPAGTVAAGTLEFAAVAAVLAVASGSPNFVRLLSAADVPLYDLSAGAVGSGALAQISPYPVLANGLLYVDFARLIEP
jgi:hypothetical protein